MKRIISIQDFSCLGRCSQTVALPVLSAMGVECVALPTALLSAHTAVEGFIGFDMTTYLRPIIDHWTQLGLRFDAIYTGYLGSVEQVDIVSDLFDRFPVPIRLVDPVMGDHGRLYAGFDAQFPERMRALCQRADILTPNVTEACLLTGHAYRKVHDEAFIRALAEGLLRLGTKTAVITGLCPDAQTMTVALMGRDGRLLRCDHARLDGIFHGTGDLFAATTVGGLMRGLSAADAVALAAEHVVRTIRATVNDPDRRAYGVSFEATLPELMQRLFDCNWRNEG